MTERIKSIYINKKGNQQRTHLNEIWSGMKQRCLNPNSTGYHNYGGRGVSVCESWTNDFQSFARWAMLNGYRNTLQIDRIDNDGSYAPDNCQFVTHRQNCSNKRNNNEIVGVFWDKERKKWKAEIRHQKKRYSLGRYDDKEIAAFAYHLSLTSIKETGDA